MIKWISLVRPVMTINSMITFSTKLQALSVAVVDCENSKTSIFASHIQFGECGEYNFSPHRTVINKFHIGFLDDRRYRSTHNASIPLMCKRTKVDPSALAFMNDILSNCNRKMKTRFRGRTGQREVLLIKFVLVKIN